MIKNYFKTAWRNLVRNKGFMFVNLLGLSIGISATLLILLWVNDELTYDRFQKNYDHIHTVIANRDFKNRVFTDYNMVLPMARELQHADPLIENATVTTQNYDLLLHVNDTKIRKGGMTVGDHFFDIFSWKFLKGTPVSALNDPSSIVLTASAAQALFGNEDPVNKTIRIIEEKRDVKVTAILADPPGNSAFQFDFLRPFNDNDPDTKRMMENWVGSSWRVYVQTVPGADIKRVDAAINRIKKQHDPGDKISTYFTFPMKRWHLYSDFKEGRNVGGTIEYVRLFMIVAAIILLIACVNFMNLSTARSEKRSKEVGIRKTLGAGKLKLVLQFFSESMMLVFMAFLVSVGIVLLLLPYFNQLVNKKLTLDFSQPVFWLGSLAIISVTGMLAGSYPALYLSSFRPVKVLKGVFISGGKTALPRHILVVFQFMISILLISATIIVYQQIQHIKDRKTGYDAHNLLMITGTEETEKNFNVIKQELLQSRLVTAVTRSSSPITEVWWKSGAPEWNGKPADLNVVISGIRTDVDFTKTMGIQLLQGKDFSGTPADSSSVLLNKAAVEAMGLKDPIGMEMRFGNRKYRVTGITGNVVMESPFQPVDPMLTFYNPNATGVISLRIADGIPVKRTLASIETVFKKYNPAYPFEYQFADEEFGQKFIGEELISRVTNIFAGLAIFICCIGLGGLVAYTVERRFREISIRKVLGATISQVLLLVGREFLKLVLIAFVIAVPLTWWLMHHWLQNYMYHIHISILVFVAVGGLVLLLALAVVGLNTFRAAVTNPVRSLRSE